jgi:hypothetical protein
MTRPCLRITLHLSQIFLTLGLTFIDVFQTCRTAARTACLGGVAVGYL